MVNKRVAVTGVGVVSPIGIGKEAFWQALLAGKSGIGPISHFDASSYPCSYAAEVNRFEATDFINPKSARRLSRSSQFAIVSTQKALEDAHLDLQKEDPYEVGLCFGTSLGPADIYEKFGAAFYERGLKRVHPMFEGLMNHNAMVGSLAEAFDIRGYNLTVSTGCSGGNVALAHGYNAIRSGLSEVLVSGGADTPIYPLTYGLYAATRSMAPNNGGDPKKILCPYDKRRAGYIFGEGAGTLILEEMGHAQKRGARIYAEILGFGLTNDAAHSHVLRPEARDMIKAIQMALSRSSLRPEDVEYICGHANSSVIMDKSETQAIKRVFGDHAYKLAVSTIKAAIGQSMAASNAMQSVATCLALHEGILPPTLNYEVPDPELDLDYVPKTAKKRDIRVALANSWGLGGTNVVLAYRKV